MTQAEKIKKILTDEIEKIEGPENLGTLTEAGIVTGIKLAYSLIINELDGKKEIKK